VDHLKVGMAYLAEFDDGKQADMTVYLSTCFPV
jgi:hypothetical protein